MTRSAGGLTEDAGEDGDHAEERPHPPHPWLRVTNHITVTSVPQCGRRVSVPDEDNSCSEVGCSDDDQRQEEQSAVAEPAEHCEVAGVLALVTSTWPRRRRGTPGCTGRR